MKKWIPVLLLLVLTLSACGASKDTSPVQPAAAQEVPPPATADPTPMPTPEPVEIYDAYYDAGYYTDDIGNTWQYVLRIPAIRASGSDASLLNQQMYSELYPGVKDAQDAMKGKYSLVISRVDYTIHLNGNLISLVAVTDTDWGQSFYKAYNFDAGTCTIVDRAALLGRFSMTEDAFITQASATVDAYFRESYSNVTKDDFWWDRHDKSVAKENFTEDCGLFADDDGTLCMVVKLYSFAGADYYYHVFPLNTAKLS